LLEENSHEVFDAITLLRNFGKVLLLFNGFLLGKLASVSIFHALKSHDVLFGSINVQVGAVFVWGKVEVVIGVREVHTSILEYQLSASRDSIGNSLFKVFFKAYLIVNRSLDDFLAFYFWGFLLLVQKLHESY
jgi:hypothetical protein